MCICLWLLFIHACVPVFTLYLFRVSHLTKCVVLLLYKLFVPHGLRSGGAWCGNRTNRTVVLPWLWKRHGGFWMIECWVVNRRSCSDRSMVAKSPSYVHTMITTMFHKVWFSNLPILNVMLCGVEWAPSKAHFIPWLGFDVHTSFCITSLKFCAGLRSLQQGNDLINQLWCRDCFFFFLVGFSLNN